jgi:pyruvate formate lyase activating enzyme
MGPSSTSSVADVGSRSMETVQHRRVGPGADSALRVGGLTPLTTIDYPGELAAVVYCQGCPWRCGYCHNGHLLAGSGPEQWRWGDILTFLQGRRGLLDAVVFSGGEPTAQRKLASAISDVRAMGFKVGMHTAGPYPEHLVRVLSLLDWVGLDIKALPEDYPQVTGVPGSGVRAWRSLRLLLDAGIDLEVRTTPHPGLDDRDYLNRLMRKLAQEGVARYVLQATDADRMLEPDLRFRLSPIPTDWGDTPIPIPELQVRRR